MTATMGGPALMNPIGAAGIDAWARLTGTAIEPWEGRALLAMDRARVEGAEEAFESEDAPSQILNAAMFDAMFGSGKLA